MTQKLGEDDEETAARVALACWLLMGLLSAAAAGGVGFAEGDVFVGVNNGRVAHSSAAGSRRQFLASGDGRDHVRGMCFDADGNLYSTNFLNQTISKFDRNGRQVSGSWGGPFGGNPESCVVDGEGNVYTGELDGENKIRKFSPQGKALESFRPQTENRGIDWIDLAADQCTMLYTSEGARVMRYDVCRGKQLTDFARLGGPCFALRVREDGSVLVACQERVHLLNVRGQSQQTYPVTNEDLFALNLDPDGQHFWTAGLTSGNIYRVHIGSGRGTAAPLFHGVDSRPRDTSTSFSQIRNLFNQAPVRGLAVFGERTAAIAAEVARREAAKQQTIDQQASIAKAERAQKQAEAQRLRTIEADRKAAALRAEAEQQADRLAHEARLAEKRRAAEAERKRLEDEQRQLAAERLAAAEREAVAARLQAEAEARREAPVRFGPAHAVNLALAGGDGDAGHVELQGTLDLAGTTTEGKARFQLGTDLSVPGITLEVEVEDEWRAFGNSPIALPLDPDGPRRWRVRARVGRCTPGLAADAGHRLRLEARGTDQATVQLAMPLALTVEASPWLRCWGPTVGGLGGPLIVGVMVYGFVSPSRFARRVGVVLSPEEDLEEGFFHPIRAQRGAGSGFYRDARMFLARDFRLTRRSAGALARLRANGKQVFLQPWAGAVLERRGADDAWETVAAEEARMRPGVTYRDTIGGFYFELTAR